MMTTTPCVVIDGNAAPLLEISQLEVMDSG